MRLEVSACIRVSACALGKGTEQSACRRSVQNTTTQISHALALRATKRSLDVLQPCRVPLPPVCLMRYLIKFRNYIKLSVINVFSYLEIKGMLP